MPSPTFSMLVRALVCSALVGSAACVPPSSPAEVRAAKLERDLTETRRQLASRIREKRDTSVSNAALGKRIEELTQLNAEMANRLRMSVHSVETLAAERQRLASELQAAQPPPDQCTLEAAEEEDPYASPLESGEGPACSADPPRDLATTFEP